eukprot:CAMPEP_0119262070 /NCGR_PEP_ID=MMETSP1329-20130426/1910_1 /TAXON_ID=114041 /ORGANISM="Genus nov. species nov., Strain RCC1024" /LENGTH=323 /DNA_ID=CAMNT_0007261679 /DNA_START=73 /DNA_END=1041 /DNA_ORIENTATION=+
MLRRALRINPRVARAARRHNSDKDSLLQFHERVAGSLNATARLLGVPHRISVDSATAAAAQAPPAPEAPPQTTEPRLTRALRYMTQAQIDEYTSELASSGELDFEGLAGGLAVERGVYAHCVKIVLCLVHDALDALPATSIFGLRVEASSKARAAPDLLGSLRRRRQARGNVAVDAERVAAFVDRVLDVEREAGTGAKVGDMERTLHHNVCTIVVNLMADVASTVRLDCFGHSLTVDVRPNETLDALDTRTLKRKRASGRRRLFDERHVDLLTDEILADESINLPLVPDAVERTFYRRVFNFYSVVLDYVLTDVTLAVLDVES